MDAKLKKRLDSFAQRQNSSVTEIIHAALRDHLASACSVCGASRAPRAPGRSLAFRRFVEENRGTAIFVRIERAGATTVLKGRLPVIREHRLHLDPVSPSCTTGSIAIPLDDVTDWKEAIMGSDVAGWGNANPGLPVDRWGF
jgi:hypothetical protein